MLEISFICKFFTVQKMKKSLMGNFILLCSVSESRKQEFPNFFDLRFEKFDVRSRRFYETTSVDGLFHNGNI